MLGIIRSGINVAQHELSLVSNNLANAKTTGFSIQVDGDLTYTILGRQD